MPAFSQLMLLIAMLWVSSSVHPCVANGLMVALVGPGKHAVIPPRKCVIRLSWYRLHTAQTFRLLPQLVFGQDVMQRM